MKNIISIALVILVAAGMASAIAGSPQGKIAGDLQRSLDARASVETLPVIVSYDSATTVGTLEQHRTRGGRSLARLDSIRGLAGRLSKNEIEELAADPRVLSISPDRRVTGAMDVTVPTVGSDLVADNLDLNGHGITVALIDSGLSNVAAIDNGRVLARVSFVPGNRNGFDGFGHGTHIAGIIGGSGDRGAVRGIAPGVNFVSLKVLDDRGAGQVSQVIQAIDWTIANRERFGIRILNMSLGHPVAEPFVTDPLNQAVERAWAAGLLVVTSAGNRGRDGYMTINTPGNDPNVPEAIGARPNPNPVAKASVTDFFNRPSIRNRLHPAPTPSTLPYTNRYFMMHHSARTPSFHVIFFPSA